MIASGLAAESGQEASPGQGPPRAAALGGVACVTAPCRGCRSAAGEVSATGPQVSTRTNRLNPAHPHAFSVRTFAGSASLRTLYSSIEDCRTLALAPLGAFRGPDRPEPNILRRARSKTCPRLG